MSDWQIEKKIMTLEQSVLWRESLRKDGKTLSLTNGCFDLLHRGHCSYLMQARSLADKLVVLINSDASVRSLKGENRPINQEMDRAYVLACLEFVDAVVIFDSTRCFREIDAIAPDCYAKGGDYTVETLDPDEREALLKHHTKIHFLPFVAGHSTTSMIERSRHS